MRLAALFLALIAVSGCRYDKAAHFTAGMAINEYVTQQTGSAWKGCAASLGVGLLKEAYDAQGNGVVDAADVWATGGGCQVTFRF